jgi:hypothetical protein
MTLLMQRMRHAIVPITYIATLCTSSTMNRNLR